MTPFHCSNRLINVALPGQVRVKSSGHMAGRVPFDNPITREGTLRRSIFLFTAILLIASSANAQFIEQGDREIQAAAYLFTVSGVTLINLSGTYGYYYTEKLELGGGPTITHINFGFGSNTTVGLTAFARHNFTAREQVVPYISGQLYQYDLAPESPLGFADFMFLQVGGGFKYFLNEYIAYDVSGNLGFSIGGGDTSFLIVAGLSAIF